MDCLGAPSEIRSCSLRRRLAPQSSGYTAAFGASVLWASLVVFGRFLLSSGADPISIVALRATVAGVILAGVLWFRRRLVAIRRGRDFLLFLCYGAAVATNYGSYLFALKHGSVVTAVTLLYTYPAVAVILGAALLKEKVTRDSLVALLLTLAGAALVSGALNAGTAGTSALGVLYGLSSSVAMALYAVLGKVISIRYDSWVTVMYGFVFGAAILVAVRGPLSIIETIAKWSFTNWAALLGLSIFPTLLAYGLFTYSLGFIGAGRASMICMSEPVIATVIGWVVWGEPVTTWQACGGLLVLTGVGLLIQRSK